MTPSVCKCSLNLIEQFNAACKDYLQCFIYIYIPGQTTESLPAHPLNITSSQLAFFQCSFAHIILADILIQVQDQYMSS